VFGIQSEFDQDVIDALEQLKIDEELGEQPTLEELDSVLKKMKPQKSPGMNGLPAEAFKYLDLHWTDPTMDVNKFHQVVLKLLLKKGDLSDPSKWQPIALRHYVKDC
jgi:hypothetical protein